MEPMTQGRNLSPVSLMVIMCTTQMGIMLRARKTLILGLVNLLPLLIAAYYLFTDEYVDGLTTFRVIVEGTTYPFLIPLMALFYGGPAVVDEIEGRTLTYLTLRPIHKATIYLGKLGAGLAMSMILTLGAMLTLFILCTFGGGDPGASIGYITRTMAVSGLALIAYGALFGALGAIFARSLISGIVYYVTFEVVLAAIPVLEVANLGYLIKIAAGINVNNRPDWINSIVQDMMPSFDAWIGALGLVLISAIFIGLGARIFATREYRV